MIDIQNPCRHFLLLYSTILKHLAWWGCNFHYSFLCLWWITLADMFLTSDVEFFFYFIFVPQSPHIISFQWRPTPCFLLIRSHSGKQRGLFMRQWQQVYQLFVAIGALSGDLCSYDHGVRLLKINGKLPVMTPFNWGLGPCFEDRAAPVKALQP